MMLVDPRGEDACYTDKVTGKPVCHKSSDTYCVPGQDCAWRDPTENNREYDQCMDSCELYNNDLMGGTGGEICGAVTAIGAYCGGTFGAIIGAGIFHPTHASMLCRMKCGY
jgi:hypothetical protein